MIDWQWLGLSLHSKSLLTLCVALGCAYAFESNRPYLRRADEAGRGSHLLVNVLIFVIGAVVVELFIARNALVFIERLAKPDWGISAFELPQSVVFLVGFLGLDLFSYWLHRLFHKIRALWIFHVAHHSDPHVDASTTIRAHPIESMLSFSFTLVFLFSLGIPIWVYFIRVGLLIPLAIFHHANIDWPESWDRRMRWILVSPRMHRVHHSRLMRETNSNYGALFTWWDRIFKTYFDPISSESAGRYGLAALDGPQHTGLWATLKSPYSALQRRSL